MKKLGILQAIGFSVVWLASAAAREPVRTIEDLKAIEGKIETLAGKVMPCTVALVSEDTGASGSGVVTSADGLILTAAHVTDGAEEMIVLFPNGKRTKAHVLGANLSKDIGMARIVDEGPWPFVKLGESKPLEAGDWVVAMGHSEGFDPARTPPLRFGRVVSDGPGNFLTTDCTLIGGDSGGPLFDLEGRLVGINSSIGESWTNNNHAGIDGFREDWERLLAGDTWGQLQLNPLANPERPVIGIRMGLQQRRDGGVPVDYVVPGSPAAKAGLLPGDVVVGVDGRRVRGGQALQLSLAKYQAGDTVALSFLRGGREMEVSLQLARSDELQGELRQR